MRPETETDLAEMISASNGPLRIRGGGTRSIGDVAGAPLETGGLSGITLYEPGALTLVAGAGTPLAEVEAALDAENQRLAFEVPDMRGLLGAQGTSTLGGIVAANASGPRRIASGACRDFLLGVRFVDGAGSIVSNGGRVMKNVTGYDLVKLMAGSHGTLGVLTEVSFKVLPKPEAAATLVLHGLSDTEAVAAMSAALGAPYDVTGAAHDPAARQTLLRIEGFARSVAYRLERLKALFPGREITEETGAAAGAALWAGVRDAAPLQGRAGDVWRLSCTPSDAPELATRLCAEALLYDWGGGLVWALLPEGTDARTRLGAFKGHATRVRGTGSISGSVSGSASGRVPAFHPDPAPVAALSTALRRRFDPRGVLNPGLMA
ncbi:FAD-binding protein [Alloyangia pacifica]|uniref:Glycolate oxidase FAD binding subunit n=1 Tax=Alloyangia pacifica TaxID=311180 RepID=A0A1I6U642_9RHOB|nr:FAD-binding protein [Alloyangia pacifica]SDH39843.1 glycolate oxidase FAD binding subunit [Alloyangia pacifica]SFS96903.1 glycolate oxidase FAD binding subunit [Alloyangia pacifica]